MSSAVLILDNIRLSETTFRESSSIPTILLTLWGSLVSELKGDFHRTLTPKYAEVQQDSQYATQPTLLAIHGVCARENELLARIKPGSKSRKSNVNGPTSSFLHHEASVFEVTLWQNQAYFMTSD